MSGAAKIRIPTHINIKKTRAVIDMIQAPVRKVISKKVVTQTIIPGKFKTIIPATTTKEINHQVIQYKGSKYIVGYCPYKDQDKLFVIDYVSDIQYKDFITKSWHYMSDGGYISNSTCDELFERKQLYLHNYAMNKLTFNGKGQHHTIDHINRNGRDNRIINLREISQSHQNLNQSKREREVILPEGCDIDPNDIPKNIYYKKASGVHGDQFYIEIRTPEIVQILCPSNINEQNDLIVPRFRWFGTKSKTIDLRVKLQHAINKLEELRKLHPSIADLIYTVENVDEKNELVKSFNEILDLTTYPKEIIEQNKGQLFEQYNPAPITHVQEQLAQEIQKKTIRGLKSHLPEGCGITPEMIPKYCYYKPASETRGDKFIIERHPKLEKRQWTTTESKKVTTQEKFNLLLEKLKELV